jgi:transcription initiation factor TFIID TATA-box-binding protein
LEIKKREIRIQNVVASASLKHRIDLDAIVKAFPHVEYRPELFPGLPFKLKKPKRCVLIFSSGGMVCTGTKSGREARKTIMKVVKELKAAGIIIAGKPEVHIVNIVASASLGAPVDLEKLASQPAGGSIMYEPEQFPAVIYRIESPKVVFLIFATGKIVCVGANKEENVCQAVENLRLRLEEMKVMV